MEINLQAIAGTNLPKPQREIFDTFTTSLYSKGNSQAHAKTIADAIHRLCHATESEDHVGNILWNLWSVLIDIVQLIPPDHPWQETLVRALDNLRHRNGVVIRLNQIPYNLWEDLPALPQILRDLWSDPTVDEKDLDLVAISEWKSLNSFAARVMDTGYIAWLPFPIWQLRSTLECPTIKGPGMDCRLWVASEWILRCGCMIFKEMSLYETREESIAKAIQTGPLCKDLPPWSVDRWKFWKKRFREIADNGEDLALSSSVRGRAAESEKRMQRIIDERIANERTTDSITKDQST